MQLVAYLQSGLQALRWIQRFSSAGVFLQQRKGTLDLILYLHITREIRCSPKSPYTGVALLKSGDKNPCSDTTVKV